MISDYEYCQEHPNSKIGGIYMVKHRSNIQRKVCMECILTHKIPSEQILSKQDFIKKIQEKSTLLNIKNLLEQSQSKSILKKALQQFDYIQEELTLILINIKNSIKNISEQQVARDDQFLKLIFQNLDPAERSQSELDFLVDFIEGNIFEKWIQKKQQVSSQLQKAQEVFERHVQNGYKTTQLIDEIQNNFQSNIFILSSNEKIEDKTIDMEGLEKVNNKLVKTTFQLTTQKNGDKVYKKNRQILRIEKKILGQKNDEALLNLEQMKYLEFKGSYGIKGYKIKQWNYFWKGQNVGGGNFNLKGQKEGKWFDLCQNYWDKRNIIEQGCYESDKRSGDWSINWNNQRIGGGSYDKQGEGNKIGNWIELSEDYSENFQVMYHGEYVNGKKIGRWDIYYQKDRIGGGLYDETGNGLKLGNWVEIMDNFKLNSQVIFSGEYKNGKKVGRWDFKYKKDNKPFFKIGGGSYDDSGDEIKLGNWVEIIGNFRDYSQVTYRGEYKNGKKVGIWKEMKRDNLSIKEEFIIVQEIKYDN
ncbi:unnamed protein product [Paramecium pentaurelia]|uniref:MORN repeat protein n=1 Tax=Paramecium pentaurelia TaxID=43138 RepID=A0A8S1VVG2_9CILI|nr:unnamed protein product [Paramecium pentaurelia]